MHQKRKTIDFSNKVMDFSAMAKLKIYREEKFRSPLRAERAIGLWVDRIGAKTAEAGPGRLRVLGQYGAVYIEEGDGVFNSATTGRVSVGKGDVLILFPDEASSYYPTQRWTERWVVWNGPEAGVLESLGYIKRSQMVIKDSFGAVSRAFDLLSGIMDTEDVSAILERKNVVLRMVLELHRAGRADMGQRDSDGKMKLAVEYVTMHYNEDFSVPQLAEKFDFSPSQFRRLFKQYTGRRPREFVTSLRISKAKQLLSEGRAIKETARAVGYDDLFYFMRVFKKVAQVSPGKFAEEFFRRVHGEK